MVRATRGAAGNMKTGRAHPRAVKPMLPRITLAILCVSCLATQLTGPERKVLGSVITSEHDPHLRIELPSTVQYIGADRWVLYDIADCELHAFVEADANKNVQRLYWVQFESYIPSHPDLHHTYDSSWHATIGGLDFYVDTWVRANGEPTRPGSDREHIEAIIRSKGYKMPAGMMDVRLVHLLDEQKRKELMIIYGEDLAPTGLTAADLKKGGKAFDQWQVIEKGLVDRAREKIVLQEEKSVQQ
jgi:hypothetical protein